MNEEFVYPDSWRALTLELLAALEFVQFAGGEQPITREEAIRRTDALLAADEKRPMRSYN